MTLGDTYKELQSSQLPALQLLLALGWNYLTPAEALVLRGGRPGSVVLTGILEPWLREHNHIRFKGQRHPFTEGNIQEAIRKLTDEPFQSLITTNERLYELLTLGTSLTQTIDGDRKSFSLHYIDWQRPQNNHFHVTEEFVVEKRGSHATRRPDIVLFVNGIPLAVIECKRSDKEHGGQKAVFQGIGQLLDYQQPDQIPHLFAYSQLLLAISPNDALYGTTLTPKEFWAIWREEEETEPTVRRLINQPLPPAVKDHLYDWRPDAPRLRHHFDTLGERLPTEQDRTLYALLRPARLLELAYQYIVYDDGTKKIARYQQYFSVRATLDRVAHPNLQGTRTGGVIWHTTGSGKSLMMVMLAKALALHPNIRNPRVVLVTDRVDLDDQIYGTFRACGKSVAQADSGKHLVRLVTGQLGRGERRADVITTVINKFDAAARDGAAADDINIFVLVDESHRSQYGELHAKMQRVFPNGCYIGFTGTPLTKSEKSTAKKFGSFIHKYPMRQAVADQAVVPLLYEGRIVEQDVDKAQLERWFERATRDLTEDQRADLKRKMSRSEAVSTTEQRLKEVAFDIATHFRQPWRADGLKGQLATPSKAVAVRYLRYLEEFGIEAAVVISPPDMREGEAADDENEPGVQAFWKRMMERYGSEAAYLREILGSFAEADGIEILVVVDKLLTGFDEPRNTVLYIDKPLKEHTLLQAIARVNRLHEGKDYGLIIDYRGVLGELNEAINLYDALAEYDLEDVQGTFTDVSEHLRLLPQLHSDLWAIFESVPNTRDPETMQRFLEPEDRRQRFYEALTDYARTLGIALSTTIFYEQTPEPRIKQYKEDLKTFHSLRQSVMQRFGEAVNYRDYEARVRKLMNEHVRATGTTTITELVNVFDVERFDAEVARLSTPGAKADTILNRMKRTAVEHMDEDPAFYRRFSELIEETIEAYRAGRINDVDKLTQAERLLEGMRARNNSTQPGKLNLYQHAPAYYGVLRERLVEYGASDEQVADVAIGVEQIIEERKITDWASNRDVQKAMERELDDYLFDFRREHEIKVPLAEQDMLIEQVVEVARARDRGTR